ncbi:hypothetical protein IW261DRAFT_1574242 [Armillaria novae-zelandiae]|uniref:Uncharacterized protein n=1 Tax=Armillaria novae-zelandiae TaxID=153914 RepID=A0AA39TZC2_9AGAR|nr:hypothetical protein IW261DRAFT_1574242 [Armillaria novae-zelandiae]
MSAAVEAMQKRAQERVKKLQELKLKKEAEAVVKQVEEERLAREAGERWLAAEKMAADKKREEAVATEAEQTRLMELATRQAMEAVEVAAKAAEGDDDEETVENAGNEKEKAREELHWKRAEKGKVKATRAVESSKKRKRLTLSVIEDSEDERIAGPSEERPTKKVKGKSVECGEFHSTDQCGH